jgi:hypothetical protein
MAEKLMSLKGVKYVKLNTALPPESNNRVPDDLRPETALDPI